MSILQEMSGRPRVQIVVENPMIRKLERHGSLGEAERRAIADATSHRRRISAREELVDEDSPLDGLVVVLSGFASRAKLLADGRRQVLSYLVPGDSCIMQCAIMRSMDHSIVASNPMVIAILTRDAASALSAEFPRVAEALRWGRVVDEATTQEWLVNLGQRTALERTAALLSEVYVRLTGAGQARGGLCDFPFTQAEMAETLGLSAVHINRTLQELRHQGLITLSDRRLTIPNVEALFAAGVFDPAYLRLDQSRQ